MRKLQIDSEFESLIPPLTSEEFEQLKQNIVNEGCRDSLVIWNDLIIDGHNRYKICTENKIEFSTLQKAFKTRGQAVEWIILNQFGRRNLTAFERSQLALKLKPILQEKAKDNQKLAVGGDRKSLIFKNQGMQNPSNLEKVTKSVKTRDELAKIAGVSHDTIEKSEKILKKGTPEQIKRVAQGGKGNSINAIAQEVIANERETKICKQCKETLPVSEFYYGKGACKQCINSRPRPLKNIKGETHTINPELNKFTDEDIIGDLYNVDRVIEYTIDDLIEEYESNFENYHRTLNRILSNHKDLLKDKENNEKIMQTLNKCVDHVTEMKGKYEYENIQD